MRHAYRLLAIAFAPCLLAIGCKKPTPEQTPASAQPPPSTAPATPPATAPSASPSPAKPSAEHETASGGNAFACTLLKKLPPAGNLVFSPASISLALAMTYGGARAETATEMQRALHLVGGPERAPADWGKLAADLRAPSKVKLRIANRLFGEKSWAFNQAFLDATSASFGAPLERVDFKGQAEAARKQINDFAAEQTEQRIKDLVPPGGVTGTTKLALVNAIHFVGQWAHPFDSAQTKPRPFFTKPKEPKEVPTMSQTGRFRYGMAQGATFVELPYEGDSVAMWIVLPTAVDGLAQVESSLSATSFAIWDRSIANDVHIELPKFTIEPGQGLKLGAPLAALGMAQAFDKEKANFDGIGPSPDSKDRLRLDDVFHKAFVKVDEAGTEAAAATATAMKGSGGVPPKPLDFKADHPFLFVIMDKKTKLALFVGRVQEL